jgi:hypothetical protein
MKIYNLAGRECGIKTCFPARNKRIPKPALSRKRDSQKKKKKEKKKKKRKKKRKKKMAAKETNLHRLSTIGTSFTE